MSHAAPHSHGSAGYEKKDVNVAMILWVSAVIVVVLVASILFVDQFVTYQAEKAAYEIRLKLDNPQLVELRALEERALAATKPLDTAKGFYQIPIERAMELTVEQYKGNQITPVSPGGTTR